MRKPTAIALALGIAVSLGAAAFGVLRWQQAQPVDSSEAAAIAQQAELNLENMQQTLSEKIDDRPMNEAQQRMESPTGQAMFRKCAEWTEFYDNHPSDDSRANRDKTCAEYKDFVDNGVEPEQR